MGPQLSFDASLRLQRLTDWQARANMVRHHKFITGSVLAIVVFLIVMGLAGCYIEKHDRPDYVADSEGEFDPNARSPGKVLSDWYGYTERAYFTIIGLSLLTTLIAAFFLWNDQIPAVVMRHTGRWDFFLPAPLPSNSIFWYYVRKIIVGLYLSTLVIVLICGLLLEFYDPTWFQLLRLLIVLPIGVVNLAAMAIFFRYTIERIPRRKAAFVRYCCAIVVILGLFILVKAYIEDFLDIQPISESIADSLISPAGVVLFAYPAAMTVLITGQFHPLIQMASLLFLVGVPALFIYHLRYIDHRLHETEIKLKSLVGLTGRSLLLTPLESRDHRDILRIDAFTFLDRLGPALPSRRLGHRMYLAMRTTLALRGSVTWIILLFWFVYLIFYLMSYNYVHSPESTYFLQNLAILAIFASPLGLACLALVAPARNMLLEQGGLDRTLPIAARRQYLAQLFAGTAGYLLFYATILMVFFVAFARHLDELLWELRDPYHEQFWFDITLITIIYVLGYCWFALAPTAVFWILAPSFSVGVPWFRYLVTPVYLVLALLFHIILIDWITFELPPSFQFEVFICISAAALYIILAAGYVRFEEADLKV